MRATGLPDRTVGPCPQPQPGTAQPSRGTPQRPVPHSALVCFALFRPCPLFSPLFSCSLFFFFFFFLFPLSTFLSFSFISSLALLFLSFSFPLSPCFYPLLSLLALSSSVSSSLLFSLFSCDRDAHVHLSLLRNCRPSGSSARPASISRGFESDIGQPLRSSTGITKTSH